MGSFVELTLAMTFAKDTPLKIVGAFAEWQLPADKGHTGAPAPALPTLETSLGGDPFDADGYLSGCFDDDPMRGLEPLHQAALWQWLARWGNNAYFPGTSHTALRWDPYGARWTLTMRVLPKEPAWPLEIIAPLGRYALEGTRERPWFAGYILDEHSLRPVLVWSVGQEPFQFEGKLELQ
jgi:hypothetical protein